VADINVALIGYAFMGKAHSNAYRQVSHFFAPRLTPRLKVLCGRTRTEVEAAARQLGWEETATDWRSAIERPDIDIVDICTPGDTHAEIAIAAAQAGKVVFCEKPLANSTSDAARMLAAVTDAGVPHMICHNYRRAPAVTLARTLLSRGRIGQVRHYRGTYLQDWLVDPAFPRVWRLDKARSGSGALGDLASHSIDLARYLVGELTEVAATLETFVRERPLPDDRARMGPVSVDDASLAIVRFACGATGSIEATRMASGRRNYNRFEINGSEGSLAFNLERMNELEVHYESDPPDQRGFRTILVTDQSHPYVQAWWPPGHIIGYEHTFVHTVYELLEALADDRLPSPNFHDGMANQHVLSAIEEASNARTWVQVPHE